MPMKCSLYRFISFSLASFMAFTLLASCGRNVGQTSIDEALLTENCRVVPHAMGETCIPNNPQRMITLWTTTLANSLALGMQPIASTYYTGEPFPHYLQDKVNGIELIGDIRQPSLEKIVRLKPDLIVANSRLSNIYEPLSNIAPTVVLTFSSPPPPWKQQFEELADVLDREDTGHQLMNQYWQRIEALKQALGDRRHQLRVSVASISPEFGIWAYGEESPVGTVLNDIGLQRPPIQQNVYYVENISQEQLADIDGDIVFFLVRGESGTKELLQALQQKPLWQKLKAVQQDRVYFVDSGHWHSLDILGMNAVIDDLFKYLVNKS